MTDAAFADPVFPPLLSGERVPEGVDPMDKAVIAAEAGVDAGTIFWSPRADQLRAALVLAPEAPLRDAMAMVAVVANGLADALGALAPPEVAVTFDWPGQIKINGAHAGVLTAEASSTDPDGEPHWLVIGVTIQLAPMLDEPGRDPRVTALVEEGCAGLTALALLESWSRHTLVWINRWLEDGFRPVHDAWIGRVDGRGEFVRLRSNGSLAEGLFLGLDDLGGMLLKSEAETLALPLTGMLGHPHAWPPVFEDPARVSGEDDQ
ncbi:MAG: biotin/lipoate--protein ligase family protein [Pseudomonadota bacterium]